MNKQQIKNLEKRLEDFGWVTSDFGFDTPHYKGIIDVVGRKITGRKYYLFVFKNTKSPQTLGTIEKTLRIVYGTYYDRIYTFGCKGKELFQYSRYNK